MNAHTEIKIGLFSAIPMAMSEIKVLGKSDKNKFDNYDFVSIDKFLALVNPICSKHGLWVLPSMKDMETYQNTNSKGSSSTWARYHFEMQLCHSSGESITSNQFVCVPLNGAQASGSAQSYALKQFYRAIFNIPTGDKDDADLIPTEPHNIVQSWGETVLQDLPKSASLDEKTEALTVALCAQFKRKPSVGQLSNEWDRRTAEKEFVYLRDNYPDHWGRIIDAYETRKLELEDQQ